MQDHHPKTPKVLGQRNWLDISPVATAAAAPRGWQVETGALVMTLRCEDPDQQTSAPTIYPTIVPVYIASATGEIGAVPEKCRRWKVSGFSSVLRCLVSACVG